MRPRVTRRGSLWCASALAAACHAPVAPPGATAAAARRIPLEHAVLFVPEGFELPADGRVPLLVHFQGGAKVAEENFVASGLPGVLLASTLQGLSSAFARPYADPTAFPRLLAAAATALSAGATTVHFGPITITFFSAGYGAVREILRDPALFAAIDVLVAADSIHAELATAEPRTPSSAQMADFVRFAQAAARGDKVFVVAHSRIPTPYASTTDCADHLLASIGASRSPSSLVTGRGLRVANEAHVGGFHLYDFDAGQQGDAEARRIHVECLRLIPELLHRHAPQR